MKTVLGTREEKKKESRFFIVFLARRQSKILKSVSSAFARGHGFKTRVRLHYYNGKTNEISIVYTVGKMEIMFYDSNFV